MGFVFFYGESLPLGAANVFWTNSTGGTFATAGNW
jgi:hypothetical protein